MEVQTKQNLFISKINRYAISHSYNKAKSHTYNIISVLGSMWTHICILFLLDIQAIFREDIIHHPKTRDYKKQMIQNSEELFIMRKKAVK